jgi:hypothetical protein
MTHRVVFLVCLFFTPAVLAAVSIAPIGGGNALSQPAQRHVVRLEAPGRDAVWLLALQQDRQEGRGLGFFRSDDEGQTWRFAAPIQGDGTHRDAADLLAVGLDGGLTFQQQGALAQTPHRSGMSAVSTGDGRMHLVYKDAAEFYGETATASVGGTAAVTFFQRSLGVEVVHTNTTHRFLAVAPSGTAYALKSGEQESWLYESTDGARTWRFKARHAGGNAFRVMAALSDGVLLANTSRNGSQYLSRSGDGGASWQEVLPLGNYRMLTPHSIAELDGTVYLLEYQAFTSSNTPIRLYASLDRGKTWQVRRTFTGHRHGHGLAVDAVRHALWAFFGDTPSQAGTFRSTDAGNTWQLILGGQKGLIVDGTVLADGSLLFGQDIVYLPERPRIVQLTPGGIYTGLYALPGPSYSTHAVRGGGFVVGAAREPGGDIYPPGEVSAHVVGSLDGVTWEELLSYPRLDANENVRADVYFELPSGLLVLQLENAQGFGPGGRGYQLLRPLWR